MEGEGKGRGERRGGNVEFNHLLLSNLTIGEHIGI